MKNDPSVEATADDFGGAGTGEDVVSLVVPHPSTCIPARAAIVGGQHRIRPGWSPVTCDATVATAATPNWGPGTVKSIPSRSAVTFHRQSSSFEALSAKTGRAVSGIGPHELAYFEDLETDASTVEFELQGLEVAFAAGNTYRPDFIARDLSGVVVGEVKAHASYFLDPEYAATMVNAERTLRAVSIRFSKVDASTLHADILKRRNVRRAFCDRFTDVPGSGIESVRDLLATEGTVPLTRIRSLLHNDSRIAQARVHALLCRRVLAYDLGQPVTPATIVRAPREVPPIDIRNLDLAEAC